MTSPSTSSSWCTIRKPSGKSCSIEEFALSKHVSQLISRPCSATYLSQTFEYVAAVKEYMSLIDYAENYPEPGKSELSSLLFPTFVHLYLVLLQSSDSAGALDAEEFYKLFSCIFESAEGYEAILKELFALKNVDDVKKHSYFKKFRENKYIIGMSLSTLQDLRAFVEKIESKALLYVLHFHFHYQDIGMKILPRVEIKYSINGVNESPDQDTETESHSIESDCWYVKDCEMSLDKDDSRVSTIIIKNSKDSDVMSVDFNKDETKLCYTLGPPNGSCLFVSPLQQPSREHEMDEEIPIVMKSKRFNFAGTISAVKYLPTESDVLLASCGSAVKLFNSETKFESVFYGHSLDVWDIDVNSTGTHFVTGSCDKTSCFWNINESAPVQKFVGHIGTVNVVKFHPNGIYLLTGSSDCTVQLWSIENTIALRSFVDHKSDIRSIACSSDGKILASADSFGRVKIWDIKDGSKIFGMTLTETDNPHLDRITSLCFNDDDSLLSACNYKGIMGIWDVRNLNGTLVSNKYFQHTPLLVKYNKHGIWKMVFQHSEIELEISSPEVNYCNSEEF